MNLEEKTWEKIERAKEACADSIRDFNPAGLSGYGQNVVSMEIASKLSGAIIDAIDEEKGAYIKWDK